MKNKFSLPQMKKNFFNEKEINGRRRLYNSLWAFLFGILASILIIAMTGNNPFEVFQVIFQDAVNQNVRFITTTVVFIVATLGTAICFKSGIFNIGVSGQMMAGGITSILILKLIGINGGTIFLSIILSMLSGAIVAMVVGLLKAFLKVNEVVSTILLNWVVFYIVKFIIQSNIPGLVSDMSLSQNQTDPFNLPDFFQSDAWLAILSIFGIFLIVVVWFVFSKTTIGYKMKMLAMNKDASKYSGSNEKLILILIMSIAGSLAGLAGFLYYTELGVISAKAEPISMGFDTIAIALLVYNNPFGIGIASLFFSVIKLGCGALKPLFPPLTEDFAQIMFGIIIYIAAIGIVFEKFHILIYIKNNYIYRKNPDYKEVLQTYKINRKNIWSIEKTNRTEIQNIKNIKRQIWKEIKEKSIRKKEQLEKELFTTKISLGDLNEEKQQYYFQQISLIKREKDDELFKNSYYEILKIKSFAKNLKVENKKTLTEFQNSILEKQQESKKENFKKIKKGNDGNI